MLVEFRVENYRSIRDEQILSMEAGRIEDDSDPRPRALPGNDKPLLTVAALYGANASGKSNVVSALGFMRDAVTVSHRIWSPEGGVPREPFAWGPKRLEPSFFEVTLLISGVRYQYGFVTSDSSFEEEWLYAWPHGKKQIWFERDPGNDFKFGENLRGENKVIVEVTRPNALFLSAAVQHKHAQLEPIYSWFRTTRTHNLLGLRRFPESYDFLIAQILEEESPAPPSAQLLNRFRELLQNADIGIVDLRLDKSEPDTGRVRRPSFHLKHRCSFEDAWLPLEEESRGTQTLFRLAFPILRAIRDGGGIIADELESSLHPAVARKIVRLFNDPKTNPANAQLIFTTHDTNLLGTLEGEPALRRDQVWLTEKRSDGDTVLYPVSEFHPRKSENLERGYVQGRYGAIPFLGDFLFHTDEGDGHVAP
jgi:uncharacterized protein